MGKKPASRAEFVRFDVFYKDGSQRSNRKVPKPALADTDDSDAAALAIFEEQDRESAAKSGVPVTAIAASPTTAESSGLRANEGNIMGGQIVNYRQLAETR